MVFNIWQLKNNKNLTMKKNKCITFLSLLFISNVLFSQIKEYKAGQEFYISLPDYMSKTIGLNNAATIQYKSSVKDVYGFVIVDPKEDLKLAELNYSSLKEFYEYFINDFLVEEEKRTISEPIYKKNGVINFVECDASYLDKEANLEIYYLVGIVETKNNFYKVLSWSSIENKEKYKEDFRKILYSLRD
jgi:hypothetical protein